MTVGPPGPQTLFVVSGGGRGIAARCVVELARRFGCGFVLLGRTALDGPEPAWAAGIGDEAELRQRALADLQARGVLATPVEATRLAGEVAARREVARTLELIEAAGGRARYLSADVTDSMGLRATLVPALADEAERGLIHAAGALVDRPIARKCSADFDTVFGTKINGLANLLEILPPASLRYLVLFASAVGLFGNPGQSDYALANEVLNRVAWRVRHRQPGCRTLAVNWGPWDGGMVTSDVKQRLIRQGVALIRPEVGAQLLADQLSSDDPRPLLLVGARRLAPAGRPGPGPAVQRVRRRLSLEGNPFLRDHRIAAQPVLPAVCGMRWLAATAEQRWPGYRVHRWRDFRVLKGIIFDQQSQPDVVLELSRSEPDRADDELSVDARLSSESASGKVRFHYRATLALRRELPPAPLEPAPARDATGSLDGAAFYRDATLFHGPRFQGLRRLLRLDAAGVLAECRLAAVSDAEQGQFPVGGFNYFAVDVAYQTMIVWMRRHHGVVGLPDGVGTIESFRPIPFETTFYVVTRVLTSDSHRMEADVTVLDEAGRLYLRLDRAAGTASRGMQAMFAASGAA